MTHVQNTKTTASSRNSLLGNGPQASLELELVHTLVGGFTVGSTLGDLLFPSTTSNTDTVDDVSLLCLVAQSASLVGSRRSGCSVNDIELTVLPAPNLLIDELLTCCAMLVAFWLTRWRNRLELTAGQLFVLFELNERQHTQDRSASLCSRQRGRLGHPCSEFESYALAIRGFDVI